LKTRFIAPLGEISRSDRKVQSQNRISFSGDVAKRQRGLIPWKEIY